MLVNPTTLDDHPDVNPNGRIGNPMAQAAIWMFFNANRDRVILKVSFIKIRVKDLRILFEIMAGPEPV